MVRSLVAVAGCAAAIATLTASPAARALPKDDRSPGDTGVEYIGDDPPPPPPPAPDTIKGDPGPDSMSDPFTSYDQLLDGLLDGPADSWPGWDKPPDWQIWPGTTNLTTPKVDPYDRGAVFTTQPNPAGHGNWVETWVVYRATGPVALNTATHLEKVSDAYELAFPDFDAYVQTQDPDYRYLTFTFNYFPAPPAGAIDALPPSNPSDISAARFKLTNLTTEIGALYRQQRNPVGQNPTVIDVWVLFPGFVVATDWTLDLEPVPLAGQSLKGFLQELQPGFTPSTRIVKTESELRLLPPAP